MKGRLVKGRLATGAMVCGMLASLLLTTGVAFASPAVPTVATYSGTFTDGATYLIQKPSDWNGTLVLYSHGYVAPGASNPAKDAGDPATGQWLLTHGYAIAGSSYSTTGWAVQQAFTDQLAVLDYFDQNVARPTRTIAWGHSLGGMITAGLAQLYPDRFSAALPMCGVVAGGVGTWNAALDSTFAFRTLLAPASALQLVHITNPSANLGVAETALALAQATPQGRARLALSAALDDVPGWYNSTFNAPQPAPTDYLAQEQSQVQWDANVDFPFVFAFRAELEARAGGNPSWNTGVNYREQLSHSADFAEVQALYKQAGLDLNADLNTLNDAPRISADANAVTYLNKYITYTGNLSMPVLTMHTIGDGLVLPEQEQSYAQVVRKSGDRSLLRQVFVNRAGHCAFTPAETITAFQTLINRLDTGHWSDTTDPSQMNAEATALGPTLNIGVQGPVPTVVPAPASFTSFNPTPFLRPYIAPANQHD